MMVKKPFVFSLFLAFVLVPFLAFAQQAQPPGTGTQPGTAAQQDQGKTGTMGQHHQDMMQMCKQMHEKHSQIQTDFKAMDARLNEKVEAMNAAKGDQKMTAMSAVINELVTQRREMHNKMAEMHHLKGTMGHHGGGGMAGCCAMMQQGQQPQQEHKPQGGAG